MLGRPSRCGWVNKDYRLTSLPEELEGNQVGNEHGHLCLTKTVSVFFLLKSKAEAPDGRAGVRTEGVRSLKGKQRLGGGASPETRCEEDRLVQVVAIGS